MRDKDGLLFFFIFRGHLDTPGSTQTCREACGGGRLEREVDDLL